ncbi:hypothetical protein [Borrelia crocidurae]|uniref:hypothetical protein n=1 Tax=Borrelia crocidurae TaxID=29520 RepID=UPI001F5910C6|nr:hypothetical protein [Borrelia crocidurae]
MRNLFFSLLVLSCSFPKRDFSILEFSVINFQKNLISINALVDIAYNLSFFDFDVVIVKNLKNKEELDLINNKVAFGDFQNAYFIGQNDILSISILSKEKIKIQILDLIEGFYAFRLGVVVDFVFKDRHYGIVIFNFDEKIANNLDIDLVNDQVKYLSYRYENLLFILDKSELILLDMIIKNGFLI